MNTIIDPKILEFLKEEFGDSLRSVVHVDDSYNVLYARSDIKRMYPRPKMKQIFEERRADSLTSSYLEETWNAGGHFCTMYWFEDIFSFYFMFSEEELTFSVDADAAIDLPTLKKSIEEILGTNL